MNIIEKADKYADGKANEAITKAIAQAYLDGYRDGYNDREAEIPADFRDNKTMYIDLGLPSRTLWSSDYEKDGDKLLYLPYERAEYLKIPTGDQWRELIDCCKWESYIDNSYDLCWAKCIGPNGNILLFNRTGKFDADAKSCDWEVFFWLEEFTDFDINNLKRTYNAIHMYNRSKHYREKKFYMDREHQFSGYHLPVRLVR